MTTQVKVRPSGHEFLVEGHANLLQSGLHSGLRLNYGCGNGSCGMCKVRVISGEVAQTQHSDYQLSQTEKAQGYTLMCCNTAASSELTLELLEACGPQDIPQQQIVTHVRAVTTLAPHTRLLHLQTPRTHRLRFLAGQSVRLGWAMPGQDDVHATYPLASCPCDDRNLTFFITQDPADALSAHLFADDIKPGDAITVLGPSGEFVLADGNRPLVFAACDGGHFASNQCRAWSEALDQFEYEQVTHPDMVVGAQQIAHAMRADLFDIDCDFYLAGRSEFVATLRDELRAAGVAQAQIVTQVV